MVARRVGLCKMDTKSYLVSIHLSTASLLLSENKLLSIKEDQKVRSLILSQKSIFSKKKTVSISSSLALLKKSFPLINTSM